ncbi:hypothetical protein RM863_37520 [Streptomyces sp. DSM 41014]|uniref:Uncharacterized protein n=2 Tax=Streptomyces TaxID=1883 RepID=A0ABU2UXS5_9ACTN|nr:hypothetical protein [Streptomyces sp. DSM 41014]MDT0477834.1 hypothetical protein [Streptomyces sp. DSM 41014]
MATSTRPAEHPGYALLIAAEPSVRHPLAVAAMLPQLAAVPPARLVGTSYASAVQLANPDDPNTVLTTVRTAAAVEGPLLVYVAGHLVVDTRQHRLHLALARTTARTVRYTALPWHWLATELQHRAPGTTTVVADLAADPDVWQSLVQQEQALDGPYALYGAVQLHDRRHRPSPSYTHALAHILRTVPARPTGDDLHHQTARAARVEPTATLWLGPAPANPSPPSPAVDAHQVDVPAPRPEPAQLTAPFPAAAEDPHRAISEASQAGRHAEAGAIAAAWEQAALRQHGAISPEVAHWIEVRAVIALEEGAPDRACELWLRGAVVRLTAGQSEIHPEVAAAVDRAHYAWHRVSDLARARELGTELSTLRTQVPGKSGAREDVQRRMADLSRALLP